MPTEGKVKAWCVAHEFEDLYLATFSIAFKDGKVTAYSFSQTTKLENARAFRTWDGAETVATILDLNRQGFKVIEVEVDKDTPLANYKETS
jgi:hypothetical protein